MLRIERKGAEAFHFTDCAFEVGKIVALEIDWETRLDHMQQHSGILIYQILFYPVLLKKLHINKLLLNLIIAQHLISAKAQQLFSLPTTSWSLNKDDTMVEFGN